MYFAALRCTTNPPSVPLPRHEKSATPMELSVDNCPAAFRSFLAVWSHNVDPIQNLAPEYQHDLARVICTLTPLQNPPEPSVFGIAQDLRAVAIEISQRRSFQDRYADDLQAALDAGNSFTGGPKSATFVPPPAYEPSPPISPARSHESSPQYATHDLPPQSPDHLSPNQVQGVFGQPPTQPRSHSRNSSHPASLTAGSPSHSRNSSVSSSRSRQAHPVLNAPRRTPSPSPSPTLLSPSTTRAIDLIRETL